MTGQVPINLVMAFKKQTTRGPPIGTRTIITDAAAAAAREPAGF